MVVYNLLIRHIGLPFVNISFYLSFSCTNIAQEQTVTHCISKCGYWANPKNDPVDRFLERIIRKLGVHGTGMKFKCHPLKYYCSVSLFIIVLWDQYSPKQDQHSCDLAISLSCLKNSDEQHLKTTLPFHHQVMAPALLGTAHLGSIAEMDCDTEVTWD